MLFIVVSVRRSREHERGGKAHFPDYQNGPVRYRPADENGHGVCDGLKDALSEAPLYHVNLTTRGFAVIARRGFHRTAVDGASLVIVHLAFRARCRG